MPAVGRSGRPAAEESTSHNHDVKWIYEEGFGVLGTDVHSCSPASVEKNAAPQRPVCVGKDGVVRRKFKHINGGL